MECGCLVLRVTQSMLVKVEPLSEMVLKQPPAANVRIGAILRMKDVRRMRCRTLCDVDDADVRK